MSQSQSNSARTVAIHIAAAGLGTAVAGPLGGVLGGALGPALVSTFGPSAGKLIDSCIANFGEAAGNKFLDSEAGALCDKLRPSSPDLESACRETLRRSLLQIRKHTSSLGPNGFDDWFANWDICLKAPVPLHLDPIQPGQVAEQNFARLLPEALERLDAQGQAIQQKSVSISLKTRTIPAPLNNELNNRLPECFRSNFREVLVQPDFEKAWKQAELIFREELNSTLGRVDKRTEALPQVAEDTAVSRAILERLESALQRGLIPEHDSKAKDEQIARLTERVAELEAQLASRSEPEDTELLNLLSKGDLDSALQIKSRQVQSRRSEADKLPRDLYELGTIYELRFEWSEALDAYRKAWQLEKNPDYGSEYARLLQEMNRPSEAIAICKQLLKSPSDPEDQAATLNNLAMLYVDTRQLQEADKCYEEALAVYRKVAESNPDACLPNVAKLLNNRANLYRITQRQPEAEKAYQEALLMYRKATDSHPDTYLPDVAMTLNNLAVLFREAQRLQEAEQCYEEALAIYRKTADSDLDIRVLDAVTTLNNLANLYSDTQRTKEAEKGYQEALAMRRKLAELNPDAYLHKVAGTLCNLGLLYAKTKRLQEAKGCYQEALAIQRKLAASNPDAYLPDVANTLKNLAQVYRATSRLQEAETNASEAERLLNPFWLQDPMVHGDLFARILATRAMIAAAGEAPSTQTCDLLRQALGAAHDTSLKAAIRKAMNEAGDPA